MSKKHPIFRRQETHRYVRVGESYRRPKGIHSKMRHKFKGNLPLVEIGYRSPNVTRYMHPSGLMETLVHNLDELSKVGKTAVRIAAIGRKKALAITNKAKEMGLKILNPVKEEKK